MSKKYLFLVIAASVLCALTGVFTGIAVRRGKDAPAAALSTPPPPEKGSIVLSVAGDCTLGSDPRFAYGGSFHARFFEEGENYGYFFENVLPIFEKDTLTFVNFEGTLTESENRADKAYTFKGPKSYANILKEGSVEAVSLANNHTYDFGEQGFSDTARALSEVEIPYAREDKTLLLSVQKEGKAVPVEGESTKKEGEVYIGILAHSVWYDGADVRAKIEKNINELKEKGADLVFASFHWGLEGEHYPYEVQKNIGRFAIDKGADGVWGHHPHVLQGIETYKGKEIVYSLGNFCFGGNHNPADKDCMIYQMAFETIDGVMTGKWSSLVIPCKISSRDTLNDYRPTPQEGEEKARILQRIEQYSGGKEG